MSQAALVKTVTNRYGTFNQLRHPEAQNFTDFVAQELRRKNPTKKSRNIVEWSPREGLVRTLSLGTWGEMLSLGEKPLQEVINHPLHQLFLKETK